MERPLCKGVKKDGSPCQFKVRQGHETCWRHRTQEETAKKLTERKNS